MFLCVEIFSSIHIIIHDKYNWKYFHQALGDGKQAHGHNIQPSIQSNL